MKTNLLLLLLLSLPILFYSQEAEEPIIDMHLHCYESRDYAQAHEISGVTSAINVDAHLSQVYGLMKKYNIVKGVICGSVNAVDEWISHDPDNRFIRGILVFSPEDLDTVSFINLIKNDKIKVFGEIAAIYAGYALNDGGFEPFLDICERNDIPVAIHTGGGPPGISSNPDYKNYRLALGNPFLIEDVLVKHPKLRIYMMHAGEVFYENAVRLMLAYPQLYTDIAVLLWIDPLPQTYAVDFLKRAKQAGVLDRVMFGSDEMYWPGAIEKSIEYLNSLSFLTEKEKRDILYNNAARFLNLSK